MFFIISFGSVLRQNHDAALGGYRAMASAECSLFSFSWSTELQVDTCCYGYSLFFYSLLTLLV